MVRLAHILLVCGFGCLFSIGAAVADEHTHEHRPTLRTGFVEFPPFKYADENGEASGPWVDMTEKVAHEAGYRIKWIHLPIARVYLYLQNGEIDMWPGAAGIPQLKGSVYESTVTPMRVVLYAFHRSDAASPDSLDFLVGQPLIMINGFSYMGALKHLPLDKDDLSYAPDHEKALRMLELQRGRYLLDYDEPIAAIKDDFPSLDLTGTPIFEARGAFVMSKAYPNAQKAMAKLEAAYHRLNEQGALKALQ